MANINEERLRKFKEMGIPAPMAPVDPSTVQSRVKNTEFAKKLAAIKNGTKKEELNTFIEKEKAKNGFAPLELPAKRNIPGRTPQKEINETIAKPATSGPSFDAYEKALFGESSPSPEVNVSSKRGYVSDVESDSNGSDFISDMKARLAEKYTNAPKGQVILSENKSKQQQQQSVPEGYKLINENELKETITAVSSQLIKKFMSEFLTSQPNLIKENDKIKKAEIIKDDIIKMEGRFFKLTPVIMKKK
jgi:hypothetical protein